MYPVTLGLATHHMLAKICRKTGDFWKAVMLTAACVWGLSEAELGTGGDTEGVLTWRAGLVPSAASPATATLAVWALGLAASCGS